MKLADYLLNQGMKELKDMSEFYSCNCNRNSKMEMVQSLHNCILYDHPFPADKRASRSVEHDVWTFMTYLLYQKHVSFSPEELRVKAERVRGWLNLKSKPETWLTQLLKRGWLLNVRNRTETRLECPADVQQELRKQLGSYWLRQVGKEHTCSELCPGREWIVQDERGTIEQDLWNWLSFLNGFAVPLTRDGGMHKRFFEKLMRRMQVPEKAVDAKSWRFGYGRRFPQYPDRFALLYDFSFQQGWIGESSGHVALTPLGEDLLDTGSKDEERVRIENGVRHQLYRFYVRSYRKPVPSLSFLCEWLQDVFLKQWISVPALYRVAGPWLPNYYFDDERTVFERRILGMLQHLGYIMSAYDPKSKNVYVKATKRSENSDMTVSENFSLLTR
jgi:hypothetical protein